MFSTASPIQEFRFERGVDLMASATLRHTVWILRGNPLTGIAAAGVVILILIAIFGPSIAPYDPIASRVSEALLPPSAAHLAGTDQLGRDTFSRLLVATRLDLVIAVAAVGISFVLGAVIGAFCGYAGGRLDRSVGRFVDVMMAFPLFVLAMAMVAALGNRVENIVIAVLHPLCPRRGQCSAQCRLGRGCAGQRRKPHLGRVAFPVAECPAGDGGADVAQSRLGHP
jgi:ABC-type dipeptide/oligopeptide/nickel transport system permease subunit